MIAVDTNVVVRLLTRDDPIQFKRAYKLCRKLATFDKKFINKAQGLGSCKVEVP